MNLIDELSAISDSGVPPIHKIIREMDVEGYCDFVERLCQITYDAEPRLMHAVNNSTLPDLHARLTEMVEDERDHHKLAERDLAVFGRKPPPRKAPTVVAFDKIWFGITPETQAAFASILFVLEGVTPRIAKQVIEARRRLDLPDDRTLFLREHIAVDDHHSDMFGQLCAKYEREHGETMLRYARETMPYVTAMATGVPVLARG